MLPSDQASVGIQEALEERKWYYLREPEEDTDGDPMENDVAEQPLLQKTVETWSPATC